MDTIKIKAEKRELTGKKAKQLRKRAIVPAVVYGSNLDSFNIQFNIVEFGKVFSKAGHSSLIDVDLATDSFKGIINEVQTNPRTGAITHAMINKVNLKEEINAEVPFTIIGEAPAVKIEKGVIVTPLAILEIKCLPTDLPSSIEVDITSLNSIGDSLTVGSLNLPDGVKLVHEEDAEKVVVTVAPPQKEEEETVVAAEPAEVELSVEKGKKDKEEAAPTETKK